jgi:hypothetical protein
MPVRPLDDQLVHWTVDLEHGTRGESLIGLVGAWLDRDLTADPVGSADAPDEDAHR